MAEKSLNHLIKGGVEGLRERKKRETRQRISDVATGMFLDRGFDSVRVSEVAEACGVSEKTVYNYFPTKESLLLDREEDIADALRAALGPNGTRTSPVDAFIDILDAELERYSEYWSEEGDADDFLEKMRRFADVVQETASLRSAYADMMTRLTRIAAEAIAARAGMDPDEPEPQIAASSLLGLRQILYLSILRSDGTETPAEVRSRARNDLLRAARLIDSGLWSFGPATQAGSNRDQLLQSAETAQKAAKQVVSALKQAHRSWRALQRESGGDARAERAAMKRDIRRGVNEIKRTARQEAIAARRQAMSDAREKRRSRGK